MIFIYILLLGVIVGLASAYRLLTTETSETSKNFPMLLIDIEAEEPDPGGGIKLIVRNMSPLVLKDIEVFHFVEEYTDFVIPEGNRRVYQLSGYYNILIEQLRKKGEKVDLIYFFYKKERDLLKQRMRLYSGEDCLFNDYLGLYKSLSLNAIPLELPPFILDSTTRMVIEKILPAEELTIILFPSYTHHTSTKTGKTTNKYV